MKGKNSISSVLIVLLFCGYSYAAEVCDHVLTMPVVEQVIVANTGYEFNPTGCMVTGSELTGVKWLEWTSSPSFITGCEAATCWEDGNCTVFTYSRACPQAVKDGLGGTSKVVKGQAKVTGVASGGERAAAEAWAEAWFASTPYPSDDPRTRTDSAKGLSYTSTMGQDNQTVDVDVVAWKRASFTSAGSTPIPLSEVGGTGGGSGGGASAAEIEQAMINALTGVGNFEAIEGALKSALEYEGLTMPQIQQAFENALTNVPQGGGGGGTGGLTADEMLGLLNQFLHDNHYNTLSTPRVIQDAGDGRYAARGDTFKTEIGAVFNSFVGNMKTTGIYTSISGFFGGIPAAGAAPVVQINGGRYGNHSFDFGSWTSILAVISTTLKVVFTFIAVRIVAINGV